ncbi:MAG: putative metal-binding motif-containing protein, partial [Deltaproteobacteria bacterium]|nr:putative metal-binding motif-containing protein [Deltaproteobacteria bacterium]
ALINPGATEIAGNGIDENCNGMADDVVAATGTMVTGQTEVTHEWRTVTLSRSFADPIVIVGPPSYNDAAAGVIQLRNVQADSFEIRYKEWTYLDGAHNAETVSYLVMEEGRHTLADGGIWEAGSFYLGATAKLKSQVFTQGFSDVPALLLTAQTTDGTVKPVTVRASNVTAGGFRAALYTQETLQGSHAQEKIGYVAVWRPGGSGTVEAAGGGVSYTVSDLLATSTFTQGDGFALRLEEEQSKDTEVQHVTERVNVVRIGSALFAQLVTLNGADPAACRYVEGSWNPATAAKVGVRRGSSWYLKQANSAAAAAVALSFGFSDIRAGDQVFAGDWNGDGVATIGMRRGNTFYLRHSNSSGAADQVFTFGLSSDQVIIGDWNGDGVDTIGIKRGYKFYLKNKNASGKADKSFNYGFKTPLATDVALAGDWNGDGVDSIGLKRGNTYFLRNWNSAGNANYTFSYGEAGDTPVVGDWDGDGSDSIGVKRDGSYLLRNSLSAGEADVTFSFGETDDVPLSGKW